LWRYDWHGRQHISWRPRRRAHADAVEAGAQRWLLASGSATAVPATDHGPDIRLRSRERRGASAGSIVATQLDAANAGRAQVRSRVRPRHADDAASRKPQDIGLSPR